MSYPPTASPAGADTLGLAVDVPPSAQPPHDQEQPSLYSAIISAHRASSNGPLSWDVTPYGLGGTGREGEGGEGGGVASGQMSGSAGGAGSLGLPAQQYLSYSLQPQMSPYPGAMYSFQRLQQQQPFLSHPQQPAFYLPLPAPQVQGYLLSPPQPHNAWSAAPSNAGSSAFSGQHEQQQHSASAAAASHGVSPAELHSSSGSSIESYSSEERQGVQGFVPPASKPIFGWDDSAAYSPTMDSAPASTIPPTRPSSQPRHANNTFGQSFAPLSVGQDRVTLSDEAPPQLHSHLPPLPPYAPSWTAGKSDLPIPKQAFTSLLLPHSAPQSEYSSVADAGGSGAGEMNSSATLAGGAPVGEFSCHHPASAPVQRLPLPSVLSAPAPRPSTAALAGGQVEKAKPTRPSLTVDSAPSRPRRQATMKALAAFRAAPGSESEPDLLVGEEDDQKQVDTPHPLAPFEQDDQDFAPSTPRSPLVKPKKTHRRTASGASTASSSTPASSPTTSRPRPSLFRSLLPGKEVSGEWDSQEEFFAPYAVQGKVLDADGEEVIIEPVISKPSSFVYDSSIPAWRTYRRNFLSLLVSLSLPASASLPNFHTGMSASPIARFEVALESATYPKGTNVELLQFVDASRSLKLAETLGRQALSPASLPRGGSSSLSDTRGDGRIVYSTTFARVQYRHSTANHPSGSAKADDARFVMRCELVAVHDDGSETLLGAWASARLVVRGRSPGNFAKKGGAGGNGTRKASKRRAAQEEDEDGDEDGDEDEGWATPTPKRKKSTSTYA
ncbi:hypothetical protein JCM10213_006854 [Rhodosporidiobolus nylandii]